MKKHFLLLIFFLILVTGIVVALEESKPVQEPSSDMASKETATAELSQIVDLCATEKEEKFKKEWSKYVAQNDLKDAELKDTIRWVSDEAAMQRKKNGSLDGDAGDEEAWKEKRQRLMEEYARRASML